MKLLVPSGLKIDIVGEEEIIAETGKEKILRSYYFHMLRMIIVFPKPNRDNKFVVAREKSHLNDYLAYFFLEDIFHRDVARHLETNGFDFVGAGKWKFLREEQEKTEISDFEVWFDSSSCFEEYGFNRPKEKGMQKEMIENIKKVLTNLFISISDKIKSEKALGGDL